MGTLTYGSTVFEFDDRLLAHLKIVLVQKLRRKESFLLSWHDPIESGGGRSSIWITDGVIMHFRFHGSRPPTLNREWLDRMMMASHTGNGLVIHEHPENFEPGENHNGANGHNGLGNGQHQAAKERAAAVEL